MEINIHSGIFAIIPGFKIGAIVYRGIEIGESPQMLKGRFQLFQESIYFDLLDKDLYDFEGLKEWRAIFKAAGTDAARYRPSAEALFRRIKKQNYLSPIHSAIDLNNFFSLQYEVPIGIYDLDALKGNVDIKIGENGEEYEGINGRINSMHHMIHSADKAGPFGSPFVDSKRTMVNETVHNALQLVYHRPSTEIANAEKMTKSLMDMFLQIHGGEGEYCVVGSDS
ncbi:hypothetical protein D0469_02640 [Peribacillus saganii]|uniref:B3/B4 tRNA-binding domain-containing protein n=1 Tax=Peribacillus saganii TaxID=2303992 RepID=A0A372LTU6_9BACI|nr:phenylalanine--tRNA ligase beta subunit-related protein [Peribacillus saganii]RFU71232.1 hypothetical protein D0469_02640 [Peribacillus saganii]